MCFGDRTFCSSSESCANEECYRRFREEDAVRAEKWWGGPDYPLAISDFESATCGFVQKEIPEDD